VETIGRRSVRITREAAIDRFTHVWDRVSGTGHPSSGWLVLATAVLALAAVVPAQAWRVSRNVVTIAHEAGHAMIALVTGRRLTGIRLHSDTSGVTLSVGKPRGPGMVLTLMAGYLSPPALGLAGAATLAAGHVTALLWASVALLAGMLVMIRNAYGVLSLVVTGAVIVGVSWAAPAEARVALAYLITWFLLLAGTRPVVELQRMRRQGRAPYSDADQLARLTRLPGLLWVGLFGLAALAALVGGTRWLLW
jgi:hypothetical protein